MVWGTQRQKHELGGMPQGGGQKRRSARRLTQLRQKELDNRLYVTTYGRDLRGVDGMMKNSCVQTVLAMDRFCSKQVEPSFRFLMVHCTARELRLKGFTESTDEMTAHFRQKRADYILALLSRQEVVELWYSLLEPVYDFWEDY
eukprot:3309822-Rhodomonas_salina.1